MEISGKRRQWIYDEFSDVGITGKEEDKYPIVVLRSGFKIIKTGSVNTLVGWSYDVVNVSPKNTYGASVTFTLTDIDSFEIATGNGKERLPPKSNRTIRGTISVSNDDVDRLSESTWSLNLDKDWVKLEKNTKGKRYERLSAALPEYPPFWIRQGVKEGSYWMYSDKLNILIEKYGEKQDALPEEPKA